MGSAQTAVTLQMVGRPLGSSWRIASARSSSPNIARRKTFKGLLRASIDHMQANVSSLCDSSSVMTVRETFERRKLLLASFIGLSIDTFQNALVNSMGIAAEFADTYNDLQDLREGDGPKPKMGEIVVVDWDGYTIGYYGRIFEARNKTKGGSFEGEDKDFLKFKLGSKQVIPAFEEAIIGMSLGGIRRLIVPPEVGYPDNDFNKLGPRPTTFSGQRALDFVLKNQGLIDKTLLFDIELLKIISN